MRNLWSEADAAGNGDGDLGEIVYGSRLIGADPSLVLHGGGNTSIKSVGRDVHGEAVEVLYVKGSGWDLATIEPAGFAPLRLEPVRRLAELTSLSDTEMVNQLRVNLLDAAAPNPSVEAILHACLPHRSVLHTHADAVLALTNTADGEARVRAVWGDRVVVVPYVMPGFDLARACAASFAAQSGSSTVAMVLANHGVFTFGDDTRAAYDRMVDVITEAEEYLAAARPTGTTGGRSASADRAGPADAAPGPTTAPADAVAIAELRAQISEAAGRPMLLARVAGPDGERALAFCRRPDVASVATRGPATPDHIIRTKEFPLVGRDVAGFVAAYRERFERNRPRHADLVMLDPAPRVVLDPELGLLTAGRSAAACGIAADIWLHTIDVVEAAEALGGYVALGEADLFDVEYWELEQAKLRRGGADLPLAGQVALVTGAASGIGRATAEALAGEGAAVVGVDIDPAVETDGTDGTDGTNGGGRLGLVVDVTDAAAVERATAAAAARFGGIDIVVAAAGIFGPSAPLAELDDSDWTRTLEVNAGSVVKTLRAAHRYLRLAPAGGRVVVVGSKNVRAPGVGAAAYSASKAAVAQVGRVAALEWAGDGITVNTVHPDAVFDTGLWSDELIRSRADSYEMTPAQYRRRNLLGREITSADVGALVAAMCSPAFGATTGAQIPIDGGNDRVV
ncbi:MAG TPA: bifunctional aldolase/short-chain dehydrogenase [Acidimicrobiaceae bacterium]|nr:bifunctional aldolase/short-chain dehydrogenase [Acidimicrobiaceae bacterium]HCB37013.1 bifunctional aldolase/short-chain dehydrogenase [Acidimicrobiaceae bacterium]